MNLIKLASVTFVLAALIGCSSKSGLVDLHGKARTPIAPEQVALVETVPQDAEVIAKIETNYSYGVRQSVEEKRDYAVERAVMQAAKVGANYLVIDKIEYQKTTSGAVTTGLYDGQSVSAIEAQRTPVVFATAYYFE